MKEQRNGEEGGAVRERDAEKERDAEGGSEGAIKCVMVQGMGDLAPYDSAEKVELVKYEDGGGDGE